MNLRNLGLFVIGLASFGFIQQSASPGKDLEIQPGEFTASGFSLKYGSHHIEIVGVCKFTEDLALCWKPDGSPNKSLTERLNNALQSPAYSNRRNFTVIFQKKTRHLILKDVHIQNSNSSSEIGGMLRNDAQYSGKTEGWSTSISPNLSASENGFDGAYTSWSSVGGVFDPQTKEHPFRYQVRLPETLKVQKCEVGQFEVEGNIYEIVSIADHPKSKRMKGTMDGGGSGPVNRRPYSIPPEPKTDIMLRVVSIKNPYSSIRISLGDSNGKEIFYVDKHDKPIAYEEVSRWNNRNGVYEPGTKIVDPPYHYVGGGQFDPRSMEARKYPIAVSVLMSKGNCKNLLIYTAQHKVYVFEHIKLDVN